MIYLVLIILFLPLVSAYTFQANYFNLGSSELVDVYYTYQYYIDFFIYSLIFLGLSKAVFSKKFKDSKALSLGIGLALSFSLILYEYNSGFALLNLGPLALLLLMLLIFFVIIQFVVSQGWSWTTGISLGYVLLYSFGMLFFSDSFFILGEFFNFLNLLFWACVALAVFGFITGKTGSFNKGVRSP